MEVQRLVNSAGIISLGSQAGQTVSIELGDTSLRVIGQHGELITTVHRNGTGESSAGSRPTAPAGDHGLLPGPREDTPGLLWQLSGNRAKPPQ